MTFAKITIGYDGVGRWTDVLVTDTDLIELRIQWIHGSSTPEGALRALERLANEGTADRRFLVLSENKYFLDLAILQSILAAWSGGVAQSDRQFVGLHRVTYTVEASTMSDRDVTYFVVLRSRMSESPGRLSGPLRKFADKYGDGSNCVFLMYAFEGAPTRPIPGENRFRANAIREMRNVIKETLSKNGLQLLQAIDNRFDDDLLTNVETYMRACAFGMALLDVREGPLNHNVLLETGYMMALEKPVCLLRERAVEKLPADLVGRLSDDIDLADPGTVEAAVLQWISSLRDQQRLRG